MKMIEILTTGFSRSRLRSVQNYCGLIGLAVTLFTFLPEKKPEPPRPPRPQADIVNVQYGVADNQKLFLDIFLPPADSDTISDSVKSKSGARPAIVYIHGGGWKGGDKTNGSEVCQWFADHGYVVFTVNYRLMKDGKNIWPAQLDDVQLAVRWVRAHAEKYNIDPHRVAGMGGSAGGHLTAMLAVRDTRATGSIRYPEISSKIQCGIEDAGPTNLEGDLRKVSIIGIALQAKVDHLVGAPAASVPKIIRDASPINFVSKDTAPLLIFQGDSDFVVPPYQSITFHKALEKVGADSTLIILENQGHGLSEKNAKIVMDKSLEFLREHL